MKPQAAGVALPKAGSFQAHPFPAEKLYKITPEAEQAIQDWHHSNMQEVQRQIALLQSQMNQPKAATIIQAATPDNSGLINSLSASVQQLKDAVASAISGIADATHSGLLSAKDWLAFSRKPSEAPTDGFTYGRRKADWERVTSFPEALQDVPGAIYGRRDGGWAASAFPTTFLEVNYNVDPGQLSTGQAFYQVIDLSVATDAGSNWDSGTQEYVCPSDGVYVCVTSLRILDGTSLSTGDIFNNSYGQGVDTALQDSPTLHWFRLADATTTRNGSQNTRISSFNKGDRLKFVFYAEAPVHIALADMAIYRLF